MLVILTEQIEQRRGDLILRGLQLELAMCKKTGEAPQVLIMGREEERKP